MIHSAPFFVFPKMTEYGAIKQTIAKVASLMGEEVLINPALQIQWMTHNKDYWRQILNIDQCTPPLISGGIIMSMDRCQMDVMDHAGKFKHPYLLLLGDKDKIVDNDAAREFY